MSLGKLKTEEFNGSIDFNLLRIKMEAWMVHKGLLEANSRQGLVVITKNDRMKAKVLMLKAYSALLLSLSDKFLREVANQESVIEVWRKIEVLYLRK